MLHAQSRAVGRGRRSDFPVNAQGVVMSEENIQQVVKDKYGEAARQVAAGKSACCGGGGELSGCDAIKRDLYDSAEKSALPAEAVAASLGCGNPTSLAKLQPGEFVLDLG